MPISQILTIPSLLASTLALAYPMPVAGPPEPGSLTTSEGEQVDLDQDRARRMTVPVSIEGKGPFSFVIDTGAERTVLSSKVAKALDLEAEEPAELLSIAGTSSVNMVYVPSLKMGSKKFQGLIAPVLLAKNIGADGILGLDGLQDQRVLFDFSQDQLTIEDAALSRPNRKGREIVVTARERSGQLIITEASISGVRVNIIIDTGAQVSIGNSALKNRLVRRARKAGDDDILIAVTGDTLGVEFGQARDVRIGRAQFAKLLVAFADAPPFERLGLADKPALLLGMDVMRRFDRVAIDFPKRKIYFLPPRNAGGYLIKSSASRIKR